MMGEVTGVWGDNTGVVTGVDCTGMMGEVTGVWGDDTGVDCTRMMGEVTGVWGDNSGVDSIDFGVHLELRGKIGVQLEFPTGESGRDAGRLGRGRFICRCGDTLCRLPW